MVNKVVIKLSCVIGIKGINQSNRHYNAYCRGPNIENFEKKFYKQCKLAGPQHREFRKEILQTMQVGEGQQI